MWTTYPVSLQRQALSWLKTTNPLLLNSTGLEASPVSGPIATGIALAHLKLHLSKTAMEQVQDRQGPSAVSSALPEGVAGRERAIPEHRSSILLSNLRANERPPKQPTPKKEKHSISLLHLSAMIVRGFSTKACLRAYLRVALQKWQSTPVLLPGKSHGQRSLVGYSLWGRKELDTTERLHFLSLSFFT